MENIRIEMVQGIFMDHWPGFTAFLLTGAPQEGVYSPNQGSELPILF